MARESIYKRHKSGVVPEAGNSSYSYWFVFCANKLLVKVNADNFSIPYARSLEELKIAPVRTQYLGELEGHPCYSVESPSEAVASDGMSFNDLRSIYTVLGEDIFLLAGKALQIIAWDQTHQYCVQCGIKTEMLQGERAKKCPACGLVSYPRISPATITAVIKDKKILLTHNAAFRGNWFSIIAGFVEPGETLEECVKREVKEEAGIEVKNIRYFGSQPWPFPNSLMIGFVADYESGEIKVDGKEISEAGWYDVTNLPEIPSKISIAREIIDWYIQNNSGGS